MKRTYSVEATLTALRVCQLLPDGKVNDLPITTGKALGVSQNSTGVVLLKGLSKGHTGLVAGSKYYYDANGVISTNSTGTYLGIALSDTILYIPDYIID